MSQPPSTPPRPRTVDADLARRAFDEALAQHDQAFGTFFLARLFGFEFVYDDTPGQETCSVSFELKDFMFNPQGTLHGGVICFLMDVSMGHLMAHLVGAGATLELKTQFLKAATHGRITAQGRILQRGKSIWFLESRLTDEQGEPLAFATSTWKAPRAKPGTA